MLKSICIVIAAFMSLGCASMPEFNRDHSALWEVPDSILSRPGSIADQRLPEGRAQYKRVFPPEVVHLDISVRNGTVVSAHIENASANTIGLTYKMPWRHNGVRFGVIESALFPGNAWLFQFPTSDGRFNITAIIF